MSRIKKKLLIVCVTVTSLGNSTEFWQEIVETVCESRERKQVSNNFAFPPPQKKKLHCCWPLPLLFAQLGINLASHSFVSSIWTSCHWSFKICANLFFLKLCPCLSSCLKWVIYGEDISTSRLPQNSPIREPFPRLFIQPQPRDIGCR